MRLRFAALFTVASSLAIGAAPTLAGAAPHHNRGLTIHAAPNPVDAGDGVLIYGRLQGSGEASQTIVLFHHIAGGPRGFTQIGTTTTDSRGFYEFVRQQGVVDSNRSWYVRLAGEPSVHSRTVAERVRALVTLNASSATGQTRHPLVFTGHVTPTHRFGRVLLQEQHGDDWRTIKTGRLDAGSDFSIPYAWRLPGEHVVRAVLPSDRRNLRSASDAVSVTVEQTQNQTFTIGTSQYVIDWGSQTTVQGKLLGKGATAPQPDAAVTLCHRLPSGSAVICDQAGMTGTDGSYSFTVSPARNAWYFVKTTLPPHRRTSALFIGVRDLISLTAGSSSVTVEEPDTFSGTVTPNQAGHRVLLQRKGTDGDWHTISVGVVQADGSYSISRAFEYPGTKILRTRILGDQTNLGAASAPVTVTVAEAPASSLPNAG